MVTRPNRLGIGIDVGWRITLASGEPYELWWGNTRDDQSLDRLAADARAKYGEFDQDFGHPTVGL